MNPEESRKSDRHYDTVAAFAVGAIYGGFLAYARFKQKRKNSSDLNTDADQ